MHFCSSCGRAMQRAYANGAVVYRCHCGREEKGGAEDARIGGASFAAASTADAYQHLIRNAPFDRTNKVVRRDCVCGRDYMSLLRLGTAEVVVYVCACGHRETPAPSAEAGPGPAQTPAARGPGSWPARNSGAGQRPERAHAEQKGAGTPAAGPGPGPAPR